MEQRSIIVKSGDTLWGIAARLLGSGQRWREVYDLNREAILKAQQLPARQSRGMSGPDWIFPGTRLVLPA